MAKLKASYFAKKSQYVNFNGTWRERTKPSMR